MTAVLTDGHIRRAKAWAHDNAVTLIWLHLIEIVLLVYLVAVK